MAAGDVRPARRIPAPAPATRADVDDVILNLAPGDYCGPIEGYTGGKPSVFFRLPTGLGLCHVVSPPHVFTEQPDGSLEIRESILASSPRGGGWHGYLDAGNRWREV